MNAQNDYSVTSSPRCVIFLKFYDVPCNVMCDNASVKFSFQTNCLNRSACSSRTSFICTKQLLLAREFSLFSASGS